MEIKIVVATHKAYWMPGDPMYLPLYVGRAGCENHEYQGDNEGENISRKNPMYCELTGLYWAWKNLRAEYIGLVHYRRHFSGRWQMKSKRERVIGQKQMEAALQGVDAVVPRKRNYFIETNYSQYAHAHNIADLDMTREIIEQRCPAYLKAFDCSMKRTCGHRCNMFVMKYDCFCRYCQWLFDILFELEGRIDISSYDSYNARVFGFIGERLLDTWLETEKVSYRELPVLNLERQNWLKKGITFLLRKFGLKSSSGTIGYEAKKK